MTAPGDVLAVMDEAILDCEWLRRNSVKTMELTPEQLAEARAAIAELIGCVGDAQSLLAEIDSAVRAEHSKNGHPKSKSVAGIINERLTAALARCTGAKA